MKMRYPLFLLRMSLCVSSALANAGSATRSRSTSEVQEAPLPEGQLSLREAFSKLFGTSQQPPYWTTAILGQLSYAGPCDRPGCAEESGLWLYLRGSDQPKKITPGSESWLDLDPNSHDLKFRWCSSETGLVKLVVQQTPSGIAIELTKRSAPSESFRQTLRPDRSVRERAWEIGGHVVDSRLLMKMEARWFGVDQLLTDLLGGSVAQHLQFGFGARAYALPMESVEVLHWSEGRWRRGEQSGCPVMRIESHDPSKLSLTVWDPEGFSRAELSLPKLFSPADLNGIAAQIKFKGLRGQRRAQLQIGAQSVVAKEGDWLVKKQEGWSLLATAEQRKNWLLGNGLGEVIAVQTIERKRGRPRLMVKIYNATHGESLTTECPLVLMPPGAPSRP
jgi:hypothetical protein